MNFQSFLQDSTTCTAALINAQVDRCAYVTTECADQWDYLNFIGLYYCHLDENLFVGILICLLFVVLALQFLGTTADNFLASSLEVLTEKLKISEAVAGVTFLALANGASDVISGIVAGGKSANGVLIATGGLIGACLFTVTIVFARCIQGAGEIKMDKSYFIRDSGFLLVAVVYFFVIASIGTVTLPLTCVFFAIYAVYFGVAVWQEKTREAKLEPIHTNTEHSQSSEQVSQDGRDHHDTDDKHGAKDEDTLKPTVIKSDKARAGFSKLKAAIEKNQKETNPDKYKERQARREARSKKTLLWNQAFLSTYYHQRLILLRSKKQKKPDGAKNSRRPSVDENLKRGIEEDQKGLLEKQQEKGIVQEVKEDVEEEEEEEYSDNCFGRFMYRYDQILLFIRQLTVPQYEEDDYNKWMAFGPPVLGLLFAGWILGILPPTRSWIWYIFGGVALVLEIIVFIYRNENLAQKAGGLLSFLGFIQAALWIELVASSFMDMLALLTVISGLPLNFLSLTFLAWGNSMDDYFMDYAISKRGKGSMAVIGVFSGQLFNMLLGLGGSLFRQTLQGPITYTLFAGGEGNTLNLFLLIFCTIGLCLIIATATIKHFVVGKPMMWFLFGFYLLFLAGAVTISLLE